ncbi:MAG: Cys-tRNA(Pro) deacylase [Eubacteriales bacterium]|jgi:Cys-tRNA(Pro)/Cys-tRNA(Cys) deacylase
MAKKENKTNAMRMLDRAKVPYQVVTYEVDEEDLSGEHAAQVTGMDPDTMFKTLVLRGDKTGYVVACIPVLATLDLKALARVSGNKKVEMIHVKELQPLTGYVRGGCSPVGMKKEFPTYMDETVELWEKVALSGGQRGMQIVVAPQDILRVTRAKVAPLTME